MDRLVAPMNSEYAEQVARVKLKEFLEQHMEAVHETRGREIFMFGPEGTDWVGLVGVFSREMIQRTRLENGWIDRPEDRANIWLKVIVADGIARIEEVADWRTL